MFFFGPGFAGAHGAVEDCRAMARILNEGDVEEGILQHFIIGYAF